MKGIVIVGRHVKAIVDRIVGKQSVKEAIVWRYTINKIWIQEGIRKQQINDILQNAKEQN